MERVLDLTLKLADEGLSPEEQQELERLIEADPQARRKHLEMLEVEAALRAAKHEGARELLAHPSASPVLERRVAAVLQKIRRPRVAPGWSRRARLAVAASFATAVAAAALFVFWPPRARPPGSGGPSAHARMASARAGRAEFIAGGGGRGFSAAVLPVQAEPPADQVSLELGEGASLEVRGRGVVGVERSGHGEEAGPANRVLLEEGTIAYRRAGGPAAPQTEIVTPHARVLVRDGRAVVTVAAAGTRLYLGEGAAVVSGRRAEPTTLSAGQAATISANDEVAVTHMRAALFLTGGRKSDVPRHFLDGVIERRLETLGFRVDTVDEHDLRAHHLQGRALILVSPSVTEVMHERAQDLALHDAAIPILCSRPRLFPDLGMTAPGKVAADFSERKRHIAIAEEGHPLAGGFAGNVELLGATMPLGWGTPGPGAARVAVMRDDPERAAIFAYDRDAPMLPPATRAPARRIGFFLHPTSARFLHDRAWKLFDAAVKWATDDTP
jgi:hypothetical protein